MTGSKLHSERPHAQAVHSPVGTPHPLISIQALFLVVVPFEIKLPSWKSASSTLLCSHGAPKGIGAVRALMAVTCILQVRWVRLREVNGADLGNTTPTALEWPLMMGQAPRLMPLCFFSCRRPYDSIMRVWCCYCPRVTEKIEAQRTVAQTGQSHRA